MFANNIIKKRIANRFQSQRAWISICCLFIFTIAGALVGLSSIVCLAFPLGAVIIGFRLYIKYPLMYVGFTWWLWFITPLVRRLVDFFGSWINPNPILLAPYLVTAITILTLLKYFPRFHSMGATPFILVFAGIGYGFVIGIIQGSPTTAIRAFLDWFPPVSFAFHLIVNWQKYPLYRRNAERVFLWGTLVMGCYGVIQFLIAPPWDTFWLESVTADGIGTSFGQPEAFKIRVWSTMASSGPFAGVIGSSLLLLFASKNQLRIPAMVTGYLSFLLTLVRSSWICWIVGLAIFSMSLKSKLQLKIITTCMCLFVLVIPLTTIEPFSSVIGDRLGSISNIEQDNSANIRQENYAKNTGVALSTFFGRGLGNMFYIDGGQLKTQVLDSGVLDIFFSLGWVGAIPYLSGIGLLLLQITQFVEVRFDSFMAASRAISISMVSILLFNSAMIGAKGMILWGFLAMTIIAHKYHCKQNYFPKPK